MLKIIKYLETKDWGRIFVSLWFIVAQVWLDLRMPDYMSEITRLVQTPGSDMSQILLAGGKMLLCALGSLLSAVIVGYLVAQVAAGLAMRLRERVYSKTMSFSMEEVSGFSTASLITRTTNDINQIQMCVTMGLQAIIKAPIMAVWAIGKIAGKGWAWTAATGGTVLVLVTMLAVLISLTMPRFKAIQRLTDNLNRVTRENLTGLRVVRAYHAEDYQQARFEKANAELTGNHLFTSRAMAFMQPNMTLLMSSLGLAIYWIGLILIDRASGMARLNLFSDMVVFSQYAMQVVMAFMLLTMTFIILPRAAVSAKRINEVLDTRERILDGTVTASPADCQGEVEFRHVSFRYPDAEDDILHDVSFTAHRGETVAFIGSTGSGKSTLINLVPRFYDATEGQVLVDGVDVRRYTQEALHNKLGYVPQRAVMFSGTVASNVTYGENGRAPAGPEEIRRAVAIAQAQEFVSKMEGGYDAPIAQGGTNVSGGQKQRLAIARAVCRQPEIYIFDDSFSALDYKTDRILRKTLREQTSGATSLIVAQRIGTIVDADRIIVLDEGRVVGQGTHRELLKSCPVYLEIAQSQLTKEEIENA
ncbi:MAG: ABC transporter ATP-binding protein [Eubacteriales bacterium]|nr:ABC transporter ATP-binding protein [Eubacteriales bacterium]